MIYANQIIMLYTLNLWSQSVSSVTQSCPTLCDSMDCSITGFPVNHHLLELAQTHVHWDSGAIQPSRSPSSHFPPAFNLVQLSGSFPMSPFFVSGGQSIGASASASVLPMNIQDWYPLGLTGLISLLSTYELLYDNYISIKLEEKKTNQSKRDDLGITK